MARQKQPNPQKRQPSEDFISDLANKAAHKVEEAADHGSSIFQLVICVAGIYGSLYAPPAKNKQTKNRLIETPIA
jgi:UDP-galactose transporter B1